MAKDAFDVLLFDLGGVLIKLSGVSTMMEWTQGALTIHEMWHRWMTSQAVRKFESGQSKPIEFASSVISEFCLPVEPEAFLSAFVSWSKEVFPGTVPLLRRLSASYQLASLSNTNELHWNTARTEMGLVDLFDFNFPSHETGLLKPDRQTFEFVASALPCSPERIVFFDDNQANVESARESGMVSYQVSGIDQVAAKLKELGLL
jgi:putative hydrolase of the HAD superfamily